MRSLLVLVLLVGCASQQVNDEQARALISYYNARCIKEGVDPNDRNAMAICRVVNYRKDIGAASVGVRDCHSYTTAWGTDTTCR